LAWRKKSGTSSAIEEDLDDCPCFFRTIHLIESRWRFPAYWELISDYGLMFHISWLRMAGIFTEISGAFILRAG
jgi:hypothetical protein